MLVSAAVCPHPPLLVPGVGPEHDDQLDVLRAACWSALDALRSSVPEALVVVGAGESTSDDVRGTGSFASYGVNRTVAFPSSEPAAGGATLPLSLCVGAWLLERDGWEGRVGAATIAADGELTDCLRLGEEIERKADRVAMLVMADGSASRSSSAPMTFNPRAQEYDAGVVRALMDGDPQRVTALDGALAAEVGARGLNPLRVMAGAAAEGLFDADIIYDAAPFGVGYTVGVWERHG